MCAIKYAIMISPETAMTAFLTTELLNFPVLGVLRGACCVVTVATAQRYAHCPRETQVNAP
jgi:hypothetical protein